MVALRAFSRRRAGRPGVAAANAAGGGSGDPVDGDGGEVPEAKASGDALAPEVSAEPSSASVSVLVGPSAAAAAGAAAGEAEQDAGGRRALSLAPVATEGAVDGGDGDMYSPLLAALQAPLLASSPLNRPSTSGSITSSGGSDAPSEEGGAPSIAAADNASEFSSGSSGNPMLEAWAAASATRAATAGKTVLPKTSYRLM